MKTTLIEAFMLIITVLMACLMFFMLGRGYGMTIAKNEYMENCMKINENMPHKEVRNFCINQLEMSNGK